MLEDSKAQVEKQYSDFDIEVMAQEIIFLSDEYDTLPFDDTRTRLKLGRKIVRKFDAWFKATACWRKQHGL